MAVSIIIPVYNAETSIEIAVRSCLAQKEVKEIILIDDGSTDSSIEICNRLKFENQIIKILENKINLGASYVRNIGLFHATQKYIAFLDADDYYLDHRFSNAISLLDSNDEIDAVFGGVLVKTINNDKIYYGDSSFFNNFEIGKTFEIEKITLEEFLNKKSFLITGLTLRKTIFYKCGMFDINLKQREDTDFQIKIILNCNVFSEGSNICRTIYNINYKNTISNLEESYFYSRFFHRKYSFFAIENRLKINYFLYFFKNFIEYDYLINIKIKYGKKAIKLLLLPYFIVKLIYIKN